MKKKIAITTGVLFILWGIYLFVNSASAQFQVGYIDPSNSLLQAVESVGDIGTVSNTEQFERLEKASKRMTEYVDFPYGVLKNMKILCGLTGIVAGVLILIFSRWIPSTQENES